MPLIAGEPSALCVRVTYDEEGAGSCSASPSVTT
jgi:hypothetical protein